jgi:four helix bundle protein
MKRAHKDLDVWKEAVALATLVYRITDSFPKSEIYGITSQMRRASVSISSNIAEGAARFSQKEFLQFLNIAGGSLSELDTQVEIARQLGYLGINELPEVESKIFTVSKLLSGLISNIRKKIQ